MQTHQFSLADFQAHDPEGGRGGRWLCPCPACAAYTDPRRHRSVSMDMQTGLWNCKRGTCKAQGQVKEFWKEPPPREFVDYKTRRARERKAKEEKTLHNLTRPLLPPLPDTGLTPKEALWRAGNLGPIAEFPEAAEYLQSRGFDRCTFDILHQAGVRFSKTFGRQPDGWQGCDALVFPVRGQDGKPVSVQGRKLKPREGEPKALTFGPRSHGVFATFNLLEALQEEDNFPIAICEAPLDALALAVAGLNAIALCGCAGVPAWLSLSLAGRRIWTAFDADEAGDTSADELAAHLQAAGAIVTRLRPAPRWGKDWAEMLKACGPVGLRMEIQDCLPADSLDRQRLLAERHLIGALASGHGKTRSRMQSMEEAEEGFQWSDGDGGWHAGISYALLRMADPAKEWVGIKPAFCRGYVAHCIGEWNALQADPQA